MKCKCVEFPLKESKAEPRINEWLENNSNITRMWMTINQKIRSYFRYFPVIDFPLAIIS